MNGKFKVLATIAVATILTGTAAYAGPPRHHRHCGPRRNDGLALAAGIVNLVRTVIAPPVVVAPRVEYVDSAPVVVTPAPVRCVETVPVVVAPAPVLYRPHYRPLPPPPPPRYHRGPHRGRGGHRR